MKKYLFPLILLAWNGALYFAGASSVLSPELMLVVKYMLPLMIWLAVRQEKPDYPNAQIGGVNAIFIIFLSIAVQPILMLLIAAVGIFAPYEIPLSFTAVLSDSRYGGAVVLATSAIPAFCEGAVFRGYLLDEFRKSVIISGLFAAIMTFSFSAAPYAFVTGVFYAFITVRTRSLMAGIMAQYFVNFFQSSIGWIAEITSHLNTSRELSTNVPDSSSMDWVLKINKPAPHPDFTELSHQVHLQLVINLAIVSAVFLPVVIILMRSFLSHNRQRNFKQDMGDKF